VLVTINEPKHVCLLFPKKYDDIPKHIKDHLLPSIPKQQGHQYAVKRLCLMVVELKREFSAYQPPQHEYFQNHIHSNFQEISLDAAIFSEETT